MRAEKTPEALRFVRPSSERHTTGSPSSDELVERGDSARPEDVLSAGPSLVADPQTVSVGGGDAIVGRRQYL